MLVGRRKCLSMNYAGFIIWCLLHWRATAESLSCEGIPHWTTRKLVTHEEHCRSSLPNRISTLLLTKRLSLRGGVKKASLPEETMDDDESAGSIKSSRPGLISPVLRAYKQIPIVTRMYLSVVLMCSVVDAASGQLLDTAKTFSLDWKRTLFGLELWRPLTSAAYLGPVSMHWATNIYFLITYGVILENNYGSAAQLMLTLTNVMVLLLLGGLMGFPFVSTPLISSFIYVSSRVDPMVIIPFKFDIRLRSWMLPYALMVIDCLEAQSTSAALPHIIGILSGHFYHFVSHIYPKMGGKAWLQPPGWLSRRLDGEQMNPMKESSMQSEKKPFKPKRVGKGRKLNSLREDKAET